MNKGRKIGVIDSGLGGITVLKSLVELMPNESYIYIGDNFNAPFGDKTNDQLREIAYKITDYLKKEGIELLVVACNTISSFLLDELRERLNIPVIGTIVVTSQYANDMTENNKFGLIATCRTISNGTYQKYLNGEVYALSTPEFVPLIEEGQANTDYSYEIVNKVLEPIKDKDFDTFVLGCTHYPFLINDIKRVVNAKIIETGVILALHIKNIIKVSEESVSKSVEILVTKDKDKYDKLIKDYIGVDYSLKEIKL